MLKYRYRSFGSLPFYTQHTFIPINEINFHTQKPVFKPFLHKKRATPRAALKI